jgi:hypothetical protein
LRFWYVGLRKWSAPASRAMLIGLGCGLSLLACMKQDPSRFGLDYAAYWDRGFELHREARAEVTSWLKARPCRQLVIVHYAPDHPVDQEWVYNGADIDGSKIVWARAVSEKADRKLAQYFSGREIWTLNADAYPPRLEPYAEAKHGCM